MKPSNAILLLAIVFCGSSVILGAFGAHALEKLVVKERLDIFETAVRYQMYHGLALFLLGLLHSRLQSSIHLRWAAFLWILGIVLFSGSLYALTFTNFLPATASRILGPITPIGGTLLIIGWILFGIAVIKIRD